MGLFPDDHVNYHIRIIVFTYCHVLHGLCTYYCLKKERFSSRGSLRRTSNIHKGTEITYFVYTL
jgi:hypothetical protein